MEAALGRTLVVGIGSPHGDDRVGWLVADSLRSRELPGVDVRQSTIPADLLDWLDGVQRLIVCDACAPTNEVGGVDSSSSQPRIHRWSWPTAEIKELRSASSHAVGVPQVLQLASKLGRIPRSVVILAVEGRCFDAFADVSDDVGEILPGLVEELVADLHCEAQEAVSDA